MKQIQQLAHYPHTLVFSEVRAFGEQGCNLGGMIAGCVGMKNPNKKIYSVVDPRSLFHECQPERHHHEQLNLESKIYH